MAEQALYRKWRSQTFDELVGQEHVVQTLRNAIRSGRIGHAYLFTGPRGVGKTTMARLLAKAVNCLAPPEQRPCDQCAECRAIAEGRAVDVVEMDAASHTGVDDAREIIERVQFRPTSARIKVYIIDEVHMLSTAAFNALLKTLEEPPPHVLFILATTDLHRVPATILSRCQRFMFSRHSVVAMAAHLAHVAAAEGVELEDGVVEQIARAATGAMRDALSILDQLSAGSDGTVTLAQVRGLLGAVEAGEVGTLVEALVGGDLRAGLQTINQVADNGADLRQFTRDLVERLRALMVLAATGDATTLDLPAETLAQVQAQAAAVEVGRLVQWLKLFSGLEAQLRNSPYGQMPLEIALVEALHAPQLAAAAPAHESARPAARPSAPAAPPTSRPAPVQEPAPPRAAAPSVAPPSSAPAPRATPPQPAAAPPTPPADAAPRVIEVEDNAAFILEEVSELWPQFVEDVRADSRMMFALLDGVNPINIEGRVVVALASKGSWQKQRLEEEKNRRLLERILTKVLRSPAHLRVTIDEREEMPDERKLIQHARSDSLIRKALNIFEAEIVGIDTP